MVNHVRNNVNYVEPKGINTKEAGNVLLGALLIIAGIIVIIATLIEDITIVGIIDDIITIPLGLALIYAGYKAGGW